MARRWLMKSEPDVYSWDDLVAEGEGTWDGVRNHKAKNNLAAMAVGDAVFFYHSNIGLEIVGIAEVSVAGITDPTDETGKWAAVKIKPVERLPSPVTLKQVKAEPRLGGDGAAHADAPVGQRSARGGMGHRDGDGAGRGRVIFPGAI